MNNQTVTEPQRFVYDMLWVAISNAAVPVVGLITLPAMTKNYTAEIYAVWVQSFLVVGLLSFIINMCLGNAVVRFLASEDNVGKRRRILGVMLWPVFASACLAVVFSLWFRQGLSQILFATPNYAYLIPLVFLWAAVQAVYSLFIAYLLSRRRIRAQSVFQVCRVLYQTLVIVLLAVSGNSLVWIIGSIIIGETVLTAIVFMMVAKELGWPWPALEGLKGYLSFSIPLIPSGILFWVISSSDRFFITFFLNLGQTGIYAASLSVGNLLFIFYGPIPTVLLPILSRLWEQKEMLKVSSYLEYSNKLFLSLAIPGATGLYVLSQSILDVFTTSSYMAGGGLVLLVAVATILCGLYSINVTVILLARQTQWLMAVIAIATVANIGINVALIPVTGIIGAAIAVSVSYLILAGVIVVWARKIVTFKISIQFLAKVVAGAFLMAWCISFINFGGIFGIVVAVVVGASIFSLWMWLTKAFLAGDIELVKEIITGLKQGTMLR